jgi:hypothetical protein
MTLVADAAYSAASNFRMMRRGAAKATIDAHAKHTVAF